MKNKKKSPTFRRLLTGALAFGAFFLVLGFSDVAIEYMKKGLVLCAGTVIPSLFPFMVISELLVSSGALNRLSRALRRPMYLLFGVNEAGASAFVLGTLCGFPIGARSAASMCDRGEISKEELEHFLIFCNNPGSAFVISAVGVSLLGSKSLGVLLYLSVILSSVIVGIIGRFLLPKKKKALTQVGSVSQNESMAQRITHAVSSSASSMLTVCAYVLFFSVAVGCVGALLERADPSGIVRTLIFGFFELSSGAKAASDTSGLTEAVVLCALFLGWSGISVHLQIFSVCSGRAISFKPYIIAKVAQGAVCAVISRICLLFYTPSPKTESLGAFFSGESALYRIFGSFCLALFIAAVLFLPLEGFIGKNLRNKSKKIQKRY